jgi:hypothetical protein
MRRWFDSNWYRYLWRRHPNAASVLVTFVLAGLVVGGYLTVRATAGTEGRSSSVAELTDSAPARTKQIVTTTRVLTVTTPVTNVVTNLRTMRVDHPSTVARTTTVNRVQTVRHTATVTRTLTVTRRVTTTQRVMTTLPAKTVTVTVTLEHPPKPQPKEKPKGAETPTPGGADQKPDKGGK